MAVHFLINDIYSSDPTGSKEAVEFILYDYYNPDKTAWKPSPTWYIVNSGLFDTLTDAQPEDISAMIKAGAPTPINVSFDKEDFHWVVITGSCDDSGVYYLYDPLLQVDANRTISQGSLVDIWDRSYIKLNNG